MTADAATASALDFEPVTGAIGAVAHGLVLGAALEPSVQLRSALERALHEFGVLFFEFDRFLDASEFLGFSRLFGEPEDKYQLTLARDSAPLIDSERVPMPEYRVNCWHSDGTALERPPQAAMLTPVELPAVGGDTMWASMYAAWEALSPRYQRLLVELDALHSTAKLPFLRESTTAVHPMVIRDPVTARQMLFVNSNYTERIVGLSDRESQGLLQTLFDHVNTPEFHVRLRWRPGVVAVWEERVTQHRGVSDFKGPRKLRRLTFAGDRPAR